VRSYLAPIVALQPFLLPALAAVVGWASYRVAVKKDFVVGLALYLGLVIVVDAFMNTALYLPGFEKGSIRYSEVCAIFLLINRPEPHPVRSWRPIVLFLIGTYFTLLFGAVLHSDSFVDAVAEFRNVIVPQILTVLIVIRGFAKPEDYRRFVPLLAAVVFVIAIWDFFDIFFDRWLLHSDKLFTAKYAMNHKVGRFGSVFLNPNMLGAFMVLVFPTLFIWAMNETVKWRRVYAWSSLLALAFCVVETQSRGPMVAFAIALPLLAIGPCGGISRRRRMGFLAAFLVLFTLFMPGFFDHAVERFAEVDKELTTDEGRTRETVWGYARRMISDHPLRGIGFGEKQFVKEMYDLGFKDKYNVESLDNPHNSYLQMTVYAGIPELAVFILMNLILLGSAAVLSWNNATGSTTPSAFGYAVALAGFMVVIYPDMDMFTQDVGPVYWTLVGLLLSITTRIDQPIAAVQPYEDSRAHVGHASQRVAGESAAVPSLYRWDRPRATSARPYSTRQDRPASPHDPSLRNRAHGQQAPLQLDSRARTSGGRGEDDSRELFPWRRSGDVRATDADARRRKRQ